MPRLSDSTDRLALKVASGKATGFQSELLGRTVLEFARGALLAAVSGGSLRRVDLDDAVQDTVLKVLARLHTFQPGKAGLKTFVSVIARSVAGDYGRRYGREAKVFADCELPEDA